MSDLERVVHAVMHDGCEIVRYDRAGKWYIEPNPAVRCKRTLLTVGEAAEHAVNAKTVYPQQYGGRTFHRLYLRAIGIDKETTT